MLATYPDTIRSRGKTGSSDGRIDWHMLHVLFRTVNETCVVWRRKAVSGRTKRSPRSFGHFQLCVLAVPSVSRGARLVGEMAREQKSEPWVDRMARERYLPQTNIAGRFFLKLVVGKHPCSGDQCKRLLVGGQSGFGLSASFLQTREHPNEAGKLLLSTESFSVKGSASPLLHMKGLHP